MIYSPKIFNFWSIQVIFVYHHTNDEFPFGGNMNKVNVEVFGKNTISDLPKSVRIREQRKSNNVLWWYYPHKPHKPIQK